MRNQSISEEIARKIWDVLVEHCGVRRPEEGSKELAFDLYRDSFVRYATEGNWTEFRFCGNFGFGGKVWHNAGRFYVSFYSEDKTPEREAAKTAATLELTMIYEEAFAES